MKAIDLQEGIAHIEDLDVMRFIRVVENLDQYTITEKIDGAHLRVHMDKFRDIYVTRGAKNDETRYSMEFQFPDSPKYSYQRAALACMNRIHHDLVESGMQDGDWVDLEVMLTEQPNAIRYDGKDRIIFLRSEGNIDLRELRERIQKREVRLPVKMYDCADDLSLVEHEISTVFHFDVVPVIEGVILTESDKWTTISKSLQDLKDYLNEESGYEELTKGDLFHLNLNKRPSYIVPGRWSTMRRTIKYIREGVRDEVSSHMSSIKQLLIDQFLTNRKSKYNDGLEGGWLEGVVCTNESTGETFKIVDRNTFTEVNKFFYKVRNSINDKPHNADDPKSFIGELNVAFSSALGYPDLGTRKHRRLLGEYGAHKGDDFSVYVKAMNKMEQVQNYDFNSLKVYLTTMLDYKIRELHERYTDYLNTKDQLVFECNGVLHRYEGEIDRRTRIEFANAHTYATTVYNKTSNAKTYLELLSLMVRRNEWNG